MIIETVGKIINFS